MTPNPNTMAYRTVHLFNVSFDATMRDVRERVRNKILSRPFHDDLSLVEDGVVMDDLQEGVVVLNLLDQQTETTSHDITEGPQVYTLRLRLRAANLSAGTKFHLRRDFWLSLATEGFAHLVDVEQKYSLELRCSDPVEEGPFLIEVEADRYPEGAITEVATLQDEYIQRQSISRVKIPPDNKLSSELLLPMGSRVVSASTPWIFPTCYHCGTLFPRTFGSTMLIW